MSEEGGKCGLVGVLSEVEVCSVGNENSVDDYFSIWSDADEWAISSIVGRKEGVCVDFCEDKGDSLGSGGFLGAIIEEMKEVNEDKVENSEEWRDDNTVRFVAECGSFPAFDKAVSFVQVNGEMDVSDYQHVFGNTGLCLDSEPDSGPNVTELGDVNEYTEVCDVSVVIEGNVKIVQKKNDELVEAEQENNCSAMDIGCPVGASDVDVKGDINLYNLGSFDASRQARYGFPPPEANLGTSISVSFEHRMMVEEVRQGAVLARQESSNVVAEKEAMTKSFDAVDIVRNHNANMCLKEGCFVRSRLDTKELVEGSPSILIENSEYSCPSSASDFQESDFSTAYMALSWNAKDSSRLQNDKERTNQNSSPLIVFRRSNQKRAASLSNIQNNGKFSQQGGTKNSVGKSNNTSMSLRNVIEISKSASKRSCLQRRPRRSVWGEFTNLIHCFKQTDMILRYDSNSAQLQQSKRSYRRKSGTSARKPQWTLNVRNSRSRGKNGISTKSMHVKNQNFGASEPHGHFESLDMVETTANVSVSVSTGHINLAMCNKVEANQRVLEEKNEIDVQLHHGGHHGDKDVESSLTQDISGVSILCDCPGVSSLTLTESIMNKHLLGADSSPDSIVYNPSVDSSVIASHVNTKTFQNSEVCETTLAPVTIFPDDLHVAVLNSYKTSLSPDMTLFADLYLQCNKEREFLDSQHVYQLSEQDPTKDVLDDTLNQSKTEDIKKYIRKGKRTKRHHSKENGPLPSKTIEKAIRKDKMSTSFTPDHTNFGVAELNCRVHPSGLNFTSDSSKLPLSTVCSREPLNKGLLPGIKSKETKFHCTKKKGVSKGKTGFSASTKGRKEDFHRLDKGINRKLWESIMKEDAQTHVLLPEANDHMNVLSGLSSNELVSVGACVSLEKGPYLQKNAWVQCDECHKWRCISAEIADRINETNCTWTCADNNDKAFSDCSIPQEKTNKVINLELGVSDDDNMTKVLPKCGFINSNIEVFQPSCWTPIKTNLYLHRSRRTQTVDEIMICNCKVPSDGSFGCGDRCLNRLLNIECARGTCPCGDLCSNQQFQKRKYAKLKQIHCGMKGFGLQLLQDVSCGQFLIEYVGEVLDLATYEARQRYYALRGHEHFYFMTLKGGEVIDACAKGNLGRFINHSCNPNCRTEKWMVNGEVCIGLFALRGIKKGEEVTFDYNYERIFGAVAKKCVCGSSNCRGYVGAKPRNADVIVQGDSDNECFEPMMGLKDNLRKLQKSGRNFDVMQAAAESEETNLVKKDLIRSPKSSATPESGNSQEPLDNIFCPLSFSIPLEVSCERPTIVEQKENETISPITDDVQILNGSSESLNNVHNGGATCNHTFDTHLEIHSQTCIASLGSSSESVLNVNTYESNRIDAEPSCSHINSSFSHSVRKSKSTVRNSMSQKHKKVIISENSKRISAVAVSSNDGVERELNGVLCVDGGISKRMESVKGYLKLLNFTAAEGDNGCGASQSVRDLSLILDALLKTRSNRILENVINMNGWQLLHNILKQNRTKFSRTPVVRKLLKILLDLAEKCILTPEHMNRRPLHNEMESFRDTIWALTKHNDNQVHHMAWEFKRRWLPRVIKRVDPSDRDDSQLQSKPYHFNWCQSLLSGVQLDQGTRNDNAFMCVNESECQPTSCITDQPGEASRDLGQFVQPTFSSNDNNHTSVIRARKRKNHWDQPSELEVGPQPWYASQSIETQRKAVNSIDEFEGVNSSIRCIDDGPPHGFAILQNDHFTGTPEAKLIGSKVVVGYPQQSYLPNLAVAYGIPATLVQQLGISEVGESLTHQLQSWVTAPGIPFHPFPPLPPYARGELDNTKQMERPSGHRTRGHEKTRLRKQCHEDSQAIDYPLSSATGEMLMDIAETQHRRDTEAPEAKPISRMVVVGYPQQSYLPNLSVSYGMPLTLVQQLETSEGDGLTHQHQSWVVAPGIPFHPFPPLPPYPQGKLDTSKQMVGPSGHRTPGHVKTRLGKRCHNDSQATEYPFSSATGEMPMDIVDTPHIHKFVCNGDGNRFLQSGKWSSHWHQNCWPRSREGNSGWFRDGIRKTNSTRTTGNGRIYRPPWPLRGSNFGSRSNKTN